MPLPPLPSSTESAGIWSPQVYEVIERINQHVQSAERLLKLEDATPLRISSQADRLESNAIPLLQALADAEDAIPTSWIEQSSSTVVDLIVSLRLAHRQSLQREDEDVVVPSGSFISLERHTGPGRPRKLISRELLQEIFEPHRKVNLRRTSKRLGLSVNTLKTRLKEENIDYKYSDIDDARLDTIVRNYRQSMSGSGIRYVRSHLRNIHGIRIQGSRVYAAVKRVDKLGCILKAQKTTRRRVYNVSRPNALWHVDGHHKLILWGIVIHGFVDGFCRTIVGMRASDNNRATTVLDLFLEATVEHGEPSRVRADRGKENKGVALYVIAKQGLNRGSFIWGPSTHNTRIERLWVEVGAQFVRPWRAFFFRLESLHGLERQNSFHLWILHQLFLDLINEDCNQFIKEWNAHPISGDGHDESPLDMRLWGMIEKGIYCPSPVKDDCEGLDLETIKNMYGISGGKPQLQKTSTSAGYDPEDPQDVDSEFDTGEDASEQLEEESNADDSLFDEHVADEVTDEWESLVTDHDASFLPSSIHTPSKCSPFTTAVQEATFFKMVKEINDKELIPSGYGMLPEEWQEREYPAYGFIRSGRKAGRELRVALPDHVWRPRAVVWVQALYVYNYMCRC